MKECMQLVEKMSTRIRSWCSRKLSYQGRLLLVNSVLMSIHIYWVRIFILPRKFLKEMEGMSRAYLWTGEYYNGKVGYVAWSNVCLPKQIRGLGISQVQQ